MAFGENRQTQRRVPPPWFEKSVEAERAVNDLLYKPSSFNDLYAALRRHLQAFTVRNSVTAVRSIAHLETKKTSSPSPAMGFELEKPASLVHLSHDERPDDANALEVSLAAHLTTQLVERQPISPTIVGGLAWALARLSQREPFDSLAAPLYKRAADQAVNLRGRDVATLLWASVMLEIDGKLIEPLCPVVAAKAQAGELSAHDISLVLWTVAKLREEFFQPVLPVIIEAARLVLPTFVAQSLSISMWSLGLLDIEAEEDGLARQLARQADSVASVMNEQMLANCAWGAARLTLTPAEVGNFYDTIAEVGVRQLRKAENHHICNIVWAFSKADVKSDASQRYLVAAARMSRGHFLASSKPVHTAGLVWGLARLLIPENLQRGPSRIRDEGIDEARATIQAAVGRTKATLVDFRPRDISMVMWAVARALLHSDAETLFPAALSHMAASTQSTLVKASGEQVKLRVEDFSMAMWAIAGVGMCKDSFRTDHVDILNAYITQELMSKAAHVETSHLSNAVWGCAKADFKGASDVIKAVVDISGDGLAKKTWSLRHLCIVAWAVVLQGTYTRETVNFVRRVYELALRDAHYRQDTCTGHLHQLLMIENALNNEIGLSREEASKRSSLHDILVGEKEKVPVLSEDVTESELQYHVVEILSKIHRKSDIRTEFAVCGISIDVVLLPERALCA